MKPNKKQRISIIMQLGKIEDEHCEGCPTREVSQGELLNACKDCPIFKQIRSLGDELRKLSTNTADDGLEGLDEPRISINDAISVDMYSQYKKQEILDTDIARMIGFSISALGKWKRANKVESNRVTNYKKRG